MGAAFRVVFGVLRKHLPELAMREIGILFNEVMIKALQAGYKTQTRRLRGLDKVNAIAAPWSAHVDATFGDLWHFIAPDQHISLKCPYGEPGDFLIGKEAWRAGRSFDLLPPSGITEGLKIWYEADSDKGALFDIAGRYRHARFMCTWMARIRREITDIRVQRIRDISDIDIQAEGFPVDNSPPHDGTRLNACGRLFLFKDLWDSINGNKGSWEKNPLVWVITFKKENS